jgi:hypothetical protein
MSDSNDTRSALEVQWQPDFAAIDQELAPVYAALDQLRQSHRRKRQSILMHCFAIALGFFALGLGAMAMEDVPGVLFISGMAGIIIAIIYAAIRLGNFSATYRGIFKNEVFRRVTQSIAPSMVYEPHRCVDQSFFRECGLFQSRIDRYRGEDYFAGSVDQTGLLFSELHAEREETSRDSKGNTSTRWVTVFRGIFMVVDFHKEFRGQTMIQTDVAESLFGWLGRKLQNFSGDLVRLENPEFERAFKVRSTDQVEARYLLTPAMQERLLEMRRHWGNNIQFTLRRSLMFIAIPNATNWFETGKHDASAHRPVVKLFASQLLSLLHIVRTLDLNTRIWTKE